ncbi:MAG: phosphodiesterase [Roseibium sp.]
MLIAQISDTHISAPGENTCGVAPMAEKLSQCIDSINALDPKPDLVLLSGDVTHSATFAETRHAADILSALEAPLFVVPGNHDDRQVLADTFGPKVCPKNDAGFVDYVVEGFPLRIIALDTLDVGKPGGRLSEARLEWLDARLKEGEHQLTVIFAHHPPLKLGVPESDEDGFAGAEALGDIIAAYPNVERFLCGHIHLHTNTGWRGTIVTTAPSIGMQLTLDLARKADSKFVVSDPAYLLHHWTAGKALVTHSIQLSAFDGPFEFT